MSAASIDPALTDYCRELRWALAVLPERDQDEIVAELRSHVLDRAEQGQPVAATLAALGPPEAYARAFCDAHEVQAALATRRLPDLAAALVRRGAGSLLAASAGLVILVAWLAACLVGYVAVLKISDPAHVGLWLGERFFFIGIIDDPSAGRELLGPWLLPLAFVCVVVAWLLTRALSVWVLRRVK